MASKLFIDTSQGLSAGLLDASYAWDHWYQNPQTRMSTQIHKIIHEFLEEKSLSFEELDHIIISAGPGSYTGMRMTHGMGEIFQLLKKKVSSFYHFEVPSFLGIDEYCWCAKAFKGEYFLAFYKASKLEATRLVKADELANTVENYRLMEKLFWYSKDIGDQLVHENDKETLLMIQQNPLSILKLVVERNNNDAPYYFRSIDQEFKRPNL